LHAPFAFPHYRFFAARICDFGFFFVRRAASRFSLLASRDARAGRCFADCVDCGAAASEREKNGHQRSDR
jgi:hypothetical protein